MNKNITYENEQLEEVAKIAKEKGFKVYGFAKGENQKQIFFVNGADEIGTCSAKFGGISFGTVHRPNIYCGTGFGQLGKGDFDNPEDIQTAFCFYPSWARQYAGSVSKYSDWKEYTEKSCLEYYEI